MIYQHPTFQPIYSITKNTLNKLIITKTLNQKIMSNSKVIQTAVTSAIRLIVIMLCVILSGIAVPFIISVIISGLSSQATFEDCVSSVPFMLFSVIGILCTMVYIHEEIKDISSSQLEHR